VYPSTSAGSVTRRRASPPSLRIDQSAAVGSPFRFATKKTSAPSREKEILEGVLRARDEGTRGLPPLDDVQLRPRRPVLVLPRRPRDLDEEGDRLPVLRDPDLTGGADAEEVGEPERSLRRRGLRERRRGGEERQERERERGAGRFHRFPPCIPRF